MTARALILNRSTNSARYSTTESERKRQMDRKREKEGGRMQCFMKKEDESLIDVEHVETTGERCCHLS